MRRFSIRVERTGQVVASRAEMTRSLASRMVGLLGRSRLDDGEGLILTACRSIHTVGMRFAIDAVFVDGDWVVIRLWNCLRPWRITPVIWRASAVIELPSGTAARVRLAVGDRLLLRPFGA